MKRILCFGDSNTWGYIPGTGSLQRFSERERWTSLLQQRLGPEYKVIEFGLCGCEASGKHTNIYFNTDAQSIYSSVLAASSPVDMVIIMLGTNDLKTVNEWKQGDTAAGIKKLIDTTRILAPQVKIVLAAPILLDERIVTDPDFTIAAVEDSKNCAAEVAELAKSENLAFFDTNAFVHDRGSDGCHFTAESHASFADGICGMFRERI